MSSGLIHVRIWEAMTNNLEQDRFILGVIIKILMEYDYEM